MSQRSRHEEEFEYLMQEEGKENDKRKERKVGTKLEERREKRTEGNWSNSKEDTGDKMEEQRGGRGQRSSIIEEERRKNTVSVYSIEAFIVPRKKMYQKMVQHLHFYPLFMY